MVSSVGGERLENERHRLIKLRKTTDKFVPTYKESTRNMHKSGQFNSDSTEFSCSKFKRDRTFYKSNDCANNYFSSPIALDIDGGDIEKEIETAKKNLSRAREIFSHRGDKQWPKHLCYPNELEESSGVPL